MPSQKASNLVYHVFPGKQGKDTKKPKIVKNFFDIFSLLNFSPEIRNFPKIRALMKEAELFGNPLAQKRCGLFDERYLIRCIEMLDGEITVVIARF